MRQGRQAGREGGRQGGREGGKNGGIGGKGGMYIQYVHINNGGWMGYRMMGGGVLHTEIALTILTHSYYTDMSY